MNNMSTYSYQDTQKLERLAKALESIAKSLEKIANPPVTVINTETRVG